jgi:arylsulfatase
MKSDRTEMHDLAAVQEERVQTMVGQWDAWARRTGVLPWIWKPAYGEKASTVSGKTRFELKQDDDLSRSEAPNVARRPFTITVEVLESAPNGVLMAQGGSGHGYSLYFKDGKLNFAIRRSGKLKVITTSEPLPAPPFTVSSTVNEQGIVTIGANGHVIARAPLEGTLMQLPVDGLQIGRDADSAVGDYKAPFPFAGRIGKAAVELGPQP